MRKGVLIHGHADHHGDADMHTLQLGLLLLGHLLLVILLLDPLVGLNIHKFRYYQHTQLKQIKGRNVL